jgi:hypothetical protein
MGVLEPDTLTVECDNCYHQEEVFVTEYVNATFGPCELCLEETGWCICGLSGITNECFCEKCKVEHCEYCAEEAREQDEEEEEEED